MKTATFASPVDASKYSAGLGTANGAGLHDISYDTNVYRFSLLDANGADLAPGNVFGVNVATVAEANAAADIRAAIAATL